VPKYVLSFGIFQTMILACDPLAHSVPHGSFAIPFANTLTAMSALKRKADISNQTADVRQ